MASAGDFEITTAALPSGGALVKVEGDLDLLTASQLEDALTSARSLGHLIVDLTSCAFLDSTAIRILMKAAQIEGEGLSIVVRDPSILRVLEIAGVGTLIPLHSSLEAAL